MKYGDGDREGALLDLQQAEALGLNMPDNVRVVMDELEAEFALAYFNRGNAKRNLGDFEGAIADYDEAIRLDPDGADAYTSRGLAKANLGNLEGAIADFDEAIRLDPEYTIAYFNRGLVKYLNNDTEGALRDWQQAEALGFPIPDEVRAVMDELEAEFGTSE